MNALTIHNVILDNKDFRRISGLVYKHCGINLHTGKKELVRARLAKRLRLGNFKTFGEYISHVLEDASGKFFLDLINSVSTNLTSFFREKQHFDFMSKTFLPALLKKKAKKNKYRIRGWSAGCSSGEEAYSMAITLLEATKGGPHWNIKVLGSDISTSVLQKAREGIYDEERVLPVTRNLKLRYFHSTVNKRQRFFEVGHMLRRTTVFRHLNLMQNWPIRRPLDFIFCRNVMIYFDKPTQQKLVARFWDLLDSGGILFTGHSESLTGIEHEFDYVQPTIYRKP